MVSAKNDLVKAWLTKAKRDLETAKKLSANEPFYLDTAIYHCQQAAEKALKGFLTLHDCEFEKTHDIFFLLTEAKKVAPQLSNWLDAGAMLTPYATEFRYPGEWMEPENDEFQGALQTAESLYLLIVSLLPDTARP